MQIVEVDVQKLRHLGKDDYEMDAKVAGIDAAPMLVRVIDLNEKTYLTYSLQFPLFDKKDPEILRGWLFESSSGGLLTLNII